MAVRRSILDPQNISSCEKKKLKCTRGLEGNSQFFVKIDSVVCLRGDVKFGPGSNS